MADYDFPPLLTGEGPSLDAASILQAQNAGEWARTFGEHGAGKNNLMTRKRHNADIARETAANQQLQEQHQLNELRTNKGALDLYVRGKKLDMDLKLGRANLDRIAQQTDAKERMLPIEMEARQASTRAALAREEATIKSTAFKADMEEKKNLDTAAFVEHMKTSGAVRGTKAFEDAAVEGRLKFSGMDHVLYQDVVKNHGSGADPDEVLKTRQTAMAAGGPNTTYTTKLPGGVTMTDRPTLTADRTLAASQLARAQARKDRATKAADEEGAKDADTDIALWSGRLSQADAAMSSGAPDRAAIARKALNDPNASEAHKAAARRILGQ